MAIYKQPNGRSYRAIVQVEGKRRSKVAPTLKEAKRAEARLMIELGQAPAGTHITLADLIDLRLHDAELADTTAEDYGYLIQMLPTWLLDWRVVKVTPIMVAEAYRRLGSEKWKRLDKEGVEVDVGPLSDHRIRKLHGILRPAFRLAQRYEWIDRNPVETIDPPSPPPSTVVAAEIEDIRTLVAHVETEWPSIWAGLLVLGSSGCRRGELCGLQWDDFDEDAETLRFERSLSSTKKNPRGVKDIKTGKRGRRTVALGAVATRALVTHRKRQAEEHLAKGLGRSAWIFSIGGVPWRADYFTGTLAKIAAELGVKVNARGLRHYVATELIGAGVDLKTVSSRLGHSRVGTTTDTYAHAIPQRDQAAAAVLDALLG